MKSLISAMVSMKMRHTWFSAALVTLAAILIYQWPAEVAAQQVSLLGGRVTSTTAEALAGIPVRANQGNITVSVYTNSKGEYAYPDWSALKPGSYTVSVELPDFEHVKQTVALMAGKMANVDLKLISRTPSVEDVTASDIVAALPGTDEQKHLFIQCDNCHSLQHALRVPRDKEGWKQIIIRMAGERNMGRDTPNTRAFGQKQYLEPLAEYLTMIRGPGSSAVLPFKLKPRPTSEDSTRLVVTEYDVPRGGSKANIIRGDRKAAWPHDILLDAEGKYGYYTDHFSYTFGRLDRRTGEVKEYPYEVLEGMGGQEGAVAVIAQAQQRTGNNQGGVGGAHDMLFDSKGNVVFGMSRGTMVFNTKTEKFTPYVGGDTTFGLDGADNVWYLGTGSDNKFHKLDLKTGKVTDIDIPEYVKGATYDMESDAQGRSYFNLFQESGIGMYDPATNKYESFPTPTHGSGPRRGDMDDQGRAWMGLYWGGRIAMFDPKIKQVKEFDLIPDYRPYGPPYLAPYSLAVDDKHQIVWTNDFNSGRIYKIDMRTGHPTEYYMPLPYEVRDLTVEDNAPRPTLWIPAYRPPAKMVKVELY